MFDFVPQITIRDIVDILIVAFLIYRVLVYLSKTRAIQILFGIMTIILISVVSKLLNLYTLSFLVNSVLTIGIFAIIVIFQPEIRKLLARLGEGQLGVFSKNYEAQRVVDEVTRAVVTMGKDKIGGLIVFERKVKTDAYTEAGTVIDAKVSKELLVTIFWPGTPLHDGAVIIKEDRIRKAGVFLPITLNTSLPQTVGTRHRAAIGITEETDCIAVVISEETGKISIAYHGKLIKNIEPQRLKRVLLSLLAQDTEKKSIKDVIVTFIKGGKVEESN
ncbi:diadenylate cyclase CdaA [Desulfurobacterium atlanticum]|uniref:Diadenylate cyclase n=1 Tax=Desulfurobacterium atlanticum TaxID=240169 RepID=A0A238Y7Y9_9BACT|nr:diadenylate cyclase CdaA [Desulfurobacterium atlanticum]SNR66714.1 diadenylate cyclase [Desulfurobacterium atlanticum]